MMRAEIEKHGVIVLSDAWFAGGMASKNGCITKPEDMKGRKFRSAGTDLRRHVEDRRRHRSSARRRTKSTTRSRAA